MTTDSYVQVNPNSTGAKVDTVTLDNANQRQTVTIGDGTLNANVAAVTGNALQVKSTEALVVISGTSGPAVPWVAGTVYSSGQNVYSMGKVFTCTSGGTSGNVAITADQVSSSANTVIDGSVTWSIDYVIPPTDTSNYQSISLQLNAVTGGSGVRVIQSNDNTNWFPTPGYASDLNTGPIDEMNAPGLMTVPIIGRYFAVVPLHYVDGMVLQVYAYLRNIPAVGSGADLLHGPAG